MKKFLSVLMDLTLFCLFILISSNYPQSLPHYNPNTCSFFTAGNNTSTRDNSLKTDISGKYHNSMNMDQVYSEIAPDTLVALIPPESLYIPTHAFDDVEPAQGNPNASLFSLTPIYLIITENVRTRLEK